MLVCLVRVVLASELMDPLELEAVMVELELEEPPNSFETMDFKLDDFVRVPASMCKRAKSDQPVSYLASTSTWG